MVASRHEISYTRLLIREQLNKETPPRGGVSCDQRRSHLSLSRVSPKSFSLESLKSLSLKSLSLKSLSCVYKYFSLESLSLKALSLKPLSLESLSCVS